MTRRRDAVEQATGAGYPPVPLPEVYAYDTVAQAFAEGIGALIGPTAALLDHLADLFDPWSAPTEFLPWLARITGARVESGFTERQVRTAIDLAPRLAAGRGTRQALLTEAQEVYGWQPTRTPDLPWLQLTDPGEVIIGQDPERPAGRALTATLSVPGLDPALRPAVEEQLVRLVGAHCPAHLTFRAVVRKNP
ncbi:phage tail protein [Streptomyces griseoviridis]|uniref:phage tail protein n=1 Tax=Streptomyces griseoviridis TaxID=45398 RepID=UPI0033DFF130